MIRAIKTFQILWPSSSLSDADSSSLYPLMQRGNEVRLGEEADADVQHTSSTTETENTNKNEDTEPAPGDLLRDLPEWFE